MGSFVQYWHLESKSEDLESYEILLRAFNRIDELLESRPDGIQVYRGLGALQLRPPTAEEEIEGVPARTLDYLIRTGETEVQIDVNLPPSNGFSLPRETVERYSQVMKGNWRTQAIIVVWATEDLDSVAFDVGQIRRYLETEGPEISICAEDARPLSKTLDLVGQKHERIFYQEQDIQERRKTEFDLLEAVRHSLIKNYRRLVKRAPRKRIQERRLAIESITESEVATLGDLLAQCIDGRLSWEKLREAIADVSKNVRLG